MPLDTILKIISVLLSVIKILKEFYYDFKEHKKEKNNRTSEN